MAKLVLLVTFLYFINGVTSQCPENKYGPDCQYECHCRSGQTTCNKDRGCWSYCDTDSGWDGPTCQRKNVVLKRPDVHQGLGAWRSEETKLYYTADLVVDGKIGHRFFETPCALTVESTTVKAWWNVTLDEEYYIYRFDLYNRNDGGERRNNGFILSVGRSSVPGFDYKDCYRDTETGDPPLILKGTCINDTPLKGDVIQIRQTTYEPLQICELIVQVCATGWYGEECNRMCTTKNDCARCDEGQISCEECVTGKWADHCTETCNCLGGVSCEKTTGRCPEDKCAAGFQGYTCNQLCGWGTYGPDCASTCGSCYVTNPTCNITNGYCPEGDHRCTEGYQGLTCDEVCPNGNWDFDCLQRCGNCRENSGCDKINGICPKIIENLRCKPGYLESDHYCNKGCDAGKWGDNCGFNCSENCHKTDFPCQKENGACPDGGCLQGYTGDRCDNECSAGLWGYNCNETCSMNCLKRIACSRLNGTCTEGCVKGFKGERCQLTVKGATEPQTKSPSAGIIGGSVGGVAVVTLVIVLAVIFWRRRQQRKPSQDVSRSPNNEESTRSPIYPTGAVYQNMKQGPKPKPKPKPTLPESSGPDKKTLQSDNNPTSNDTKALHGDDNSTFDIYMNAQVTSASISVENFWEQVGKKKVDDEFKVDFAKFPVGPQLKHEVAVRQENKTKNRYKDLVAYDHSRVLLNPMEGNMSTDYINACYIDISLSSTVTWLGFNQPKKYIASQGPTELIINDFLRMIFEQNTGTIVMLTNLFEDCKLKCLKYWPEMADTGKFGVIEVKLLKEEQAADFVVRELSLTHLKTNKTNRVKQFHFVSWPDHGVPTHAYGLLDFRDKVNNCDSKLQGPIVVHCSAGVGRTGTYIALDYLLQEAQAMESVDVTGCVNRLREQRVNMIQSEAQYVFLHEALVEAFRMSGSSISSVDFTNVYNELSSVNPKTGRKRLAEQFEDLCKAKPKPGTNNTDRARDPANVEKNRHREILPDEDCRPYLSTPVSGGTDYINAVFLPAYKTKRGFIITQMPLTNTVVDFWRLVYGHSVNTIVMLNTQEDHDDTVGVYWTDESQKFGPFDVTVTNTDTTRDDFHIWTYALKYNGKDEGISVKQYRCKFWSDTMSQKSIDSALILIDQILPKLGKYPIIAHCMDGFTRSGLFCTSCAVIEKIKMDSDVNILQTVKNMRLQRPEIITDLEQYDFLHKIVLGYLEEFQVYANFQ